MSGGSKPRIREVIVVEGRYDKNHLSQLVDAVILETSGFAIFRNEEQLSLLRRMARERGLILLTDSDGAGFLIRNHLKGSIPKEQLKQAYIPDIFGKERRKTKPGAEGKLGVEGMPPAVLLEALRRAGATFLDEESEESAPRQEPPIQRADLYADGFSGRPDSTKKRHALLRALELPEHLSGGALLDVLNSLLTRDQYRETVLALKAEELEPKHHFTKK